MISLFAAVARMVSSRTPLFVTDLLGPILVVAKLDSIVDGRSFLDLFGLFLVLGSAACFAVMLNLRALLREGAALRRPPARTAG